MNHIEVQKQQGVRPEKRDMTLEIEWLSKDWFKGKSTPETHGFLPSNWSGFPVSIFPSSNSMIGV